MLKDMGRGAHIAFSTEHYYQLANEILQNTGSKNDLVDPREEGMVEAFCNALEEMK